MITGRSRDTTYEDTEDLKPGKASSVTAAPPTRWRRSRTSTLRPARARYAAAVKPLWPPPMTTASYFMSDDASDQPIHAGQILRRARLLSCFGVFVADRNIAPCLSEAPSTPAPCRFARA